MLLIIDNYDSFTFNLYHYYRELGIKTKVFRVDKIELELITRLKPSHILLSPGPGHPKEATLNLAIINAFHKQIPILGVCLGHQCIGLNFGGKIIQSKERFHGKQSIIQHDNSKLYHKIPNPLTVARYHSLIIEQNSLPPCFQITALSKEKEIMSIEHKHYPLFGVQFHPESLLSEYGHTLLFNFITN